MEQTANALPPVTLGQYKGLPVTRRVRPVTEAAVASELKSLARRHAPFCATSAPAARGMRVTLDFEGFLDGAPIPDSRMEQVTVTLGTAQLMPAAEQAVYGHCAGETFRFDFTYPDEFRVPELSSKTAQFEICLHTVEQKQEPTVDDALAQRLGFATLDALRESIRAKKAASHEANADRLAEAALLDLAGANLTVELPAAVLDQNADHALQQLKDKLSRSRFSLELYCQANNTTPEQLRAGYRQDAARRMRAMLAVPAIAQAENITVSNEEVDSEYARLARLHGNPEEEIRRVLARDAVAAALTNQKVQRFLLDHAAVTSIVEKELSYGLFYKSCDGCTDENHPSGDQPPPVLEPAPAPQILHGLQGYLPLRRSDLYPSQPRQGLGPLHRLRSVRLRMPQPLHLPLAGAGGARHLCRRHRQRYHLDRL